ncbi:cupin domain-containing protein [Bradyrhizobium pachyrhizi]|uniref:JmjC domain-containing protein n=1 Tax=Bradyrhizobium pachyrhizi TaxID=280333 RepID=UPI0024B1425B|nr:cupin domain-containing protein [Bradyrhizobium pachyrhizi]WFU53621.1 cupin domain-containing protein [Bradyrhizobium pachyrhizi]
MSDIFRILRSTAFKRDNWRSSHCVWRKSFLPADLLQVSQIEAMLDASLLKWPYFTILQDGRSPRPESYTFARDVIGQKIDGFADARAIWSCVGNGATLKLNDLSDWNRDVRRLVREIEDCFDVAATSYAFLTPDNNRGMLPHRDAAHVFAFQIEGIKEWRIYANNHDAPSHAGLDINDIRPMEVIGLEPGDVLYLPHGLPHDAMARNGRSFHLTVTACEPSPEDLLEGLLREFGKACPDLVNRHHTRALPEKCDEVRKELLVLAQPGNSARWLTSALAHCRAKGG